jgi:hypothetical protein
MPLGTQKFMEKFVAVATACSAGTVRLRPVPHSSGYNDGEFL